MRCLDVFGAQMLALAEQRRSTAWVVNVQRQMEERLRGSQ